MNLYAALHDVPQIFDIWAYKQVMDIIGINYNQSWYKTDMDPSCTSYEQSDNTYAYALHCPEEGHVYALMKTLESMEAWLVV